MVLAYTTTRLARQEVSPGISNLPALLGLLILQYDKGLSRWIQKRQRFTLPKFDSLYCDFGTSRQEIKNSDLFFTFCSLKANF